MSKLIVSIPFPSESSTTTDGSQAYYSYVLINDPQHKIKSGFAALNELPKADETVLVVPIRALSWHQTDLPKVPKARLHAALQGLLEERLLDDPHTIAFALSPEAQASAGRGIESAWVAACDKTWLTNNLQTLDAAGCRVVQVVPEFWPQKDTLVCVTGTQEDAWITKVNAQGVLTLPFYGNDTNGLIDALLADLPDFQPVFAEPATVTLAENGLKHKVQLRQQSDGLLHSATSLWELAQFEQTLTGDSQGVKNLIRKWQNFWQLTAWRPARWGLVALILANIIGLNIWALQQKQSLTAKREQMNRLLTQTFPNVKTVVDPQLQMAREMSALRQAAGVTEAQNFESMLHAFSSLRPGFLNINITPTAIEYSPNSTTLKGVKLTPTDFAAVQTKLKTMGYMATQNGETVFIKSQVAP
jgi:general secretion pathway protein L